jgi:HPt (histidine-containing phosphotransfer) domain-containing protein
MGARFAARRNFQERWVMHDFAPIDHSQWGKRKAGAFSDDLSPPAIDLVRLARHSLGDQDLEIELLGMFERQAAKLIGELTLIGLEDATAAAHLAHKLKGSALAVGATRVAEAAARFDTLLMESPARSMLAAALAGLAAAVSEAREAIVKLIG